MGSLAESVHIRTAGAAAAPATTATATAATSAHGPNNGTANVNIAPADETSKKDPRRFMWIPLIVLAPFLTAGLIELVYIVNERTQHPVYGAKYPRWSDLNLSFVCMLIILGARKLSSTYIFYPLGSWWLPSLEDKKGAWTLAQRTDRIERFSSVCFKFVYFIGIVYYGASILFPLDWMPTQLGGSGNMNQTFINYPFTEYSDDIKFYYMIELAYHTHSLVYHLFSVRRNDFVEMTLHHACAVLLVGYSYLANYIRCGAVILFLHDTADVFSYAIKSTVDTRHVYVTFSIYLGLLASWGYTRLYVFPSIVIPEAASFYSPPEHFYPLNWFCMIFMLVTLLCLHTYWYGLFLIMGWTFLKSGKTVDIQQKVGDAAGVPTMEEVQQRNRIKAQTKQNKQQ